MRLNIKKKLSSMKDRLGIVGEFLGFLWEKKILWMVPVFIMLMIIGALVLFAQSSALSPFIYALV